MTTLYRPVLIESAEQAEALPDGSIVINDHGDRYHRVPGLYSGWHSAVDDRELTEDLNSTFMPPTITALVPIEAEEEGRSMYTDPDTDELRHDFLPDRRADGSPVFTHTRLVTPWEEA